MAVQVGRSEEGWVGVADPCSSATLSYLLESTAGIAGCWQQHGASPAGHRAEQTGRSGLRGCSESVVRAAGQNSSEPPTLPFLRRKDSGRLKMRHSWRLAYHEMHAAANPRYPPLYHFCANIKGHNPKGTYTQKKTPHHKGEGLLLHDVRFAYPLADGVTTPGYQLPLVASSGGRRYPIHRSP